MTVELTSCNYTLRELITESLDGNKRYREASRRLRPFIDNSRAWSSRDLEDQTQQRGPMISRRGIDPDSPRGEDNILDGTHSGNGRIRAGMMTDGEKRRRRRLRIEREPFRAIVSHAVAPVR